MAHSVETKTTSNPANELRDALAAAERQLVQLSATNIEEYLVRLDRIEQLFETLEGGRLDLRPEQSRWTSLLSRLSNQPQPLAAAAAKAGGMAKLRAKHPPAESFWWHVDAEVARRRFNSARRLIITVVVTVVVVVGGYWLLNLVFPPNADAVRMLSITADLDELAQNEQYEEALTLVEEAQLELPQEPELLLWEIVFARQLARDEQADAAWQRANELLPDSEPSLMAQLGTYFLQIQDLENAAAVGDEAYALAPDNPQVTFLLANVAEASNDVPTALDMFQRTFDLAEEDNPQLAVTARFRLGILLQRAPAMQEPTFPVTPTLTITDTAMLPVQALP